MIIWLSSYPKSGNTMVRSLLSAYLFTDDGNFNFQALKNISLFPDITFFEKLGVDVSKDEKSVLMELRSKYGLDLVVMTRGAEGAVLIHSDGVVEQPGEPAKVVDTVGAGDSFTASMTLGLLAGKDYPQILVDASKVAAGVCSHAGAVPE